MSNETVKRVLIHRLGSLGDTMVALPCFHLVARVFPQAERVLLTNYPVHAKAPMAAAILDGSGLIHGHMHYAVGMRSLPEVLRLAGEIRRFRPDVLVSFMPVRPLKAVRRDRLFFRFAGVKRFYGIAGQAELQRNFDPATGLWESEASRLGRVLAGLGDVRLEDPASWSLFLTEAERATATDHLAEMTGRPLIACGPGTKMQAKDWGQERWRALLGLLSESYPDYGLVLVGASEDAPVAEFAAQGWLGPWRNLCGRLTPRETAAVLAHARLFLGPDSGPMHLAASVGVPCAIAFAARGLPGVWYPAGRNRIVYHQVSCAGCNLETCEAEARRCLTSIAVEEMAEAARDLLEGVQVLSLPVLPPQPPFPAAGTNA